MVGGGLTSPLEDEPNKGSKAAEPKKMKGGYWYRQRALGKAEPLTPVSTSSAEGSLRPDF